MFKFVRFIVYEFVKSSCDETWKQRNLLDLQGKPRGKIEFLVVWSTFDSVTMSQLIKYVESYGALGIGTSYYHKTQKYIQLSESDKRSHQGLIPYS